MVTYLIILALLFILELIYFRIADRFDIIDKPNERSSHKTIVLRGGGVVFLFGVWLWAICFGFTYPLFLLGLTAISVISFLDDVQSQSVLLRLFVHFTSVVLLLSECWMDSGQAATSAHIVIYATVGIIALIVAAGVINAFNFMDGINGITGGYAIAVLLPLLYLDTEGLALTGLIQPFVEPSLIIVTLLAALVFCFFNFRKQARCFAGDVGSVSIAFIIVFVLGNLLLQTHDCIYVLFLAVYGVDVVLTICHRIMLHEHLGVAHRKHAYQLMANELHIPHTTVAAFYAILQLVISAGLIFVPWPWLYCACILAMLCLAYIWFMRKYYHLHAEYLKQIQQDAD